MMLTRISAVLLLFGAFHPAALAADPAAGGSSVLRMLEGLNVFGSVRVRYEGIFDDTAISNNRGRLRLHAGFSKTFGDIASLTFVGTTGSTAEPTSTNQTFTGNFGPKSFLVDRAYGTLRPVSNLELFGGKMPVPFVRTDLIWDADLNPEGTAQKLRIPFSRGAAFVNMGQFVFNSSATTEDGYLVGFQAGLTHQFRENTRLTIAPAYTQAIRPNATLGVGLNGNLTNSAGTALVSDYRVVNVPVTLETKLRNGVPFWIDLDVAKNRGAKSSAGKTYDAAFLAEVSVGRSKARGDWTAKYRYARIEPDAVLSAFNDSDFSFTDSKGHRVKIDYVVWDPLKLSATGFFLKPVRAGVRPNRTRIQVDASLSF